MCICSAQLVAHCILNSSSAARRPEALPASLVPLPLLGNTLSKHPLKFLLIGSPDHISPYLVSPHKSSQSLLIDSSLLLLTFDHSTWVFCEFAISTRGHLPVHFKTEPDRLRCRPQNLLSLLDQFLRVPSPLTVAKAWLPS